MHYHSTCIASIKTCRPVYVHMADISSISIFGIKFRYANVQRAYAVQAMYKIEPSKAVVEVDWPVYALSSGKHKCLLKHAEKMTYFSKLPFCQILFYSIKFLHVNAQCTCIAKAKYLSAPSNAVVRVYRPMHVLFIAQAEPILNTN